MNFCRLKGLDKINNSTDCNHNFVIECDPKQVLVLAIAVLQYPPPHHQVAVTQDS